MYDPALSSEKKNPSRNQSVWVDSVRIVFHLSIEIYVACWKIASRDSDPGTGSSINSWNTSYVQFMLIRSNGIAFRIRMPNISHLYAMMCDPASESGECIQILFQILIEFASILAWALSRSES